MLSSKPKKKFWGGGGRSGSCIKTPCQEKKNRRSQEREERGKSAALGGIGVRKLQQQYKRINNPVFQGKKKPHGGKLGDEDLKKGNRTKEPQNSKERECRH